MNGHDRLRERITELKDENRELTEERDDLLRVVQAILSHAEHGPIQPDDLVLVEARAAAMNATLAVAA